MGIVAAASPATVGSIAMRRTMSLLFLLVLAWVAWWSTDSGGGLPPESTPAAAPVPVPVDSMAPVEPVAAPVPSPTIERDEVVSTEATPELPLDRLAHPFEQELRVTVLDEFALPVADAVVFVAARGCGFARWPEPTDELGRLTVRLRSRTRQLDLLLGLFTAARAQPMRWVSLSADRPHAIAIVVHGEPGVSSVDKAAVARRLRTGTLLRASQPRRRDELDIECGRTQLLFREFDCSNCHEPSVVREFEPFHRAALATPGLHPVALLQDRSRPRHTEPRSADAAADGEAPAAPATPPAVSASGLGWVTGTVRYGDGTLAGEVPVVWLGEDGRVRMRCQTDAEGSYRLQPVPTGLWPVVAGGGGHGVARAQVAVLRAQASVQDFRLATEQTVRGVATGEDGGALVGWRVEFERSDGDWAGFATTARDGSFVFAGVPGLGTCLCWPHDRDCRLPALYDLVGLVDAQVVQAALNGERPTRARLVVHPGLPPGVRRDAVLARATQLDSGRAATMIAGAQDDAFELTGLPPGAYRVEVGAPGLGWVETAVAQIDGRGRWDLLRVALPPLGQLRIVTPDRSPLPGDHALLRRLPELDVYEDAVAAPNGALLLPPGEHVLLWRDPELHAVAFRIASGEQTVVAIAPR